MTVLRHTPGKNHRYWCYSPEGDGFTFWATAKERDDYAEREIRTYLDDNEWFEEVEGVMAGVITDVATAVDIQRPVGEIDEEGYDENDEGPWEDKDQIRCNYQLRPLTELQP